MSTETIVEEQPETAPSDTPAALPSDTPIGTAPVSADEELDQLLRDFDNATNKPAEPTVDAAVENTDSNTLDDLLKEYAPSADQQKIAGLESQLNEMRTQLHRGSEIKAYHDYADDLERHVQEANPSVPDGFVKLMMDSWAHNPEVALAWDVRNIDPKAAAVDLAHVQHALRQLQADPNANPKQVQQLNTLAYQLNAAVNSASVLRQVRNQIITEAKKMKPPIDEQVTADREGLAQYIRDGQTKFIPEPKIDFATMTDKEFAEWCRKNIRN